MQILYIVSTPIGNLQDVSLRVAKTLQEVDAILCEDTRKTGMLLKFINEQLPLDNKKEKPMLISYYEQNEIRRIPEVINFLKNGKSAALVSDAGTPTISDPGFKLVRECVKEGIKIESIPGPSSVISSLVVSGLPTDKFLFIGYPPRKSGNRNKYFRNISLIVDTIKLTVIMFEAPHRMIRTLMEMREVFGEIDIVLCRELTKVHEEIRREKISESIAHFEQVEPKGEFVVLFNIQIED